jgi:hypothetical protein
MDRTSELQNRPRKDRFRTVIAARNLSYTAAAALLGKTTRYLDGIFAGERPLSARTRDAMRAALGNEALQFILGHVDSYTITATQSGPVTGRRL